MDPWGYVCMSSTESGKRSGKDWLSTSYKGKPWLLWSVNSQGEDRHAGKALSEPHSHTLFSGGWARFQRARTA